jgi:hypothetical protein
MEGAFHRQSALPVLVVGGMYEVDVVLMQQRSRATGFVRPVLRCPADSGSMQPTPTPLRDNAWAKQGTPTGTGMAAAMAWGGGTGCRALRPGVVRYELRGDPGNGDTREVREYNMAFGQFLRLHSGPGSRQPRVTRVDVYENAPLAAKFARERERLLRAGAPVGETWVFHGTSPVDNVVSIMCDGFKVGGCADGVPVANGAAYGSGVYTAKGPNTPMCYGRKTGQVILARALQGRRGAAAPAPGGSGAAGPDSWEPRGDWVVFRGGEQLLPVYVVHYDSDDVRPASAASSAQWAQPAPHNVKPAGGPTKGCEVM